MLINEIHLNELNSPNQTIKARVELYKGSALEKICNCGDFLSDFTIEKTGEGKYFGFGICQKLQTNLIDIDRVLNITKDHTIEASFGVGSDYLYPFPNFYIEDVNRDETSNLISITAYDALYKANNHTVSELELPTYYTIRTFATACAKLLNIPIIIDAKAADSFDLMMENGANFEGTETIRTALNRVAEATQTIYYMDSNWDLYFKRLDKDGEPVLKIGKASYIDLQNEGARVLGNIIHTTELGDSVSTIAPEGLEDGVTQYIRDNPFWELREDIGALMDEAQVIVGGTVISEIECYWLGNYLLEIGDKISLVAEDDTLITSYVLDDTITFDGTLSQLTKWAYDDNSAETADNPTTLGEALNKTYARVDKVNKRIELVASESSANSQKIGRLEVTTDNITGTVSDVQKDLQTVTDEVTGIKNTTQTQSEKIGKLEVTTENITGTVSNVQSKIETVEDDVNGLKTTTETHSTKIGSLEVTTENITSTVSDVQTEVKTVEDDVSGLKTTTESHSTKIGELEVTTGGITATVSNVQKDIETIEDDISGLKTTTSSQTEKLGKLEVTTEEIKGTVSEVQTDIETIEGDVSSVKSRVSTAETEISQTKEDISLCATKEEVETVDGKVKANTENISALQINAQGIAASVKSVEEKTQGQIDGLNDALETVTKQASLAMTEEQVKIAIESELSNGTDKVNTSTGYTFDDTGLTIEKSDSEISTKITEDGMTVSRAGEEVLVANNQGVNAVNLHASTYLIVGGNSRFETYYCNGSQRTACFWIG